MDISHPKLLITGATGFVGRSVLPFFIARGFGVVGAGRSPFQNVGAKYICVGNIDKFTNWKEALDGVDVVVHLAARAHQMKETPEELHLYNEINFEGTVNLARQSVLAGVRKFIFISSIKAMISDAHEEPLTESFPCNPVEPYGISKLMAEQELMKIADAAGMKAVILRPPLIYGPGVKGNMESLIGLVKRFPLLPLAGIENRRSLLGVKNLASAIETAINSERADGKTFLLADGEEISTSELVKRLAAVFNPSCRLIRLPQWFWQIAEKIPLFAAKVVRVTGSLPVDSSFFTKETGWKAPYSMLEQLRD